MAMSTNLTRTHLLIAQRSKMQHEFYSYETSNSLYFQTHKSEYLDKVNALSNEVFRNLNDSYDLQYFEDFELSGRIDLIKQELEYNNRLFEELIRLVFLRGFKDEGVEGIMRKHAHELENYPGIVALLSY